MKRTELGNELRIQVSVAGETPDGEIAETEGDAVREISVTRMVEHVLVHKSATEDLLTGQTQPVFSWVLAGLARSIRPRNLP